MSRANIEKFYEIASSNPALGKSLVEGAQSESEVLERAVAAAKSQGLEFSHDDVSSWVGEQRAMVARGELSDFQLESVSGGKELVKNETNDTLHGGAGADTLYGDAGGDLDKKVH